MVGRFAAFARRNPLTRSAVESSNTVQRASTCVTKLTAFVKRQLPVVMSRRPSKWLAGLAGSKWLDGRPKWRAERPKYTDVGGRSDALDCAETPR